MSKKTKRTTARPVKAYKNLEFLNSPAARLIRVLSEMVEPESRFRRYGVRDTVAFFGSSRTLPRQSAKKNLRQIENAIKRTTRPTAEMKKQRDAAKRDLTMSRYYEDAVRLAEKLTRWFKTLEGQGRYYTICTGGGPGIMEAANRGASKAGGRSVGLNISLPFEQEHNPYQSPELSFEFHYFFIRKFWFFYLAKALIVFPGGFGTLDEFFELLTLVQTKRTKKPMPVVLYGSDYWNQVINIEAMVKWGTVSAGDLELFQTCDAVDEAFDYLKKQISRYYFDHDREAG